MKNCSTCKWEPEWPKYWSDEDSGTWKMRGVCKYPRDRLPVWTGEIIVTKLRGWGGEDILEECPTHSPKEQT